MCRSLIRKAKHGHEGASVKRVTARAAAALWDFGYNEKTILERL